MIGVLDRLTRSIERPQVPLSGANLELYDALTGGAKSDSGVVVSRTTALRHPPMWRGVNLLSRDVGKLPLMLYRRDGEGKRRAPEHPAFNLLRHKPNSQMVAFTLKQVLTAHAICHGNGYGFIRRGGDARPLEVLPLLPDRTYPVRENGRLLYVTAVGGDMEDPASEIRKILPENVLHIKGLGYDGLCGYSLIQFGADTIGHGIALQRYGSRFFKNSARPSVVIEVPASLSEPAAKRLRESWERLYSGLDNAHRAAVLEEGAKLHPFSISARDSQLIEAQKFDLTVIANLLNLPPHKVGGEGRTSYNSLEQENQAYLDEGLDPWLVAWEEECRDKLLTEEEKRNDTHVVEFMRQALVRADMPARGAFYHNALLDGWMSRDEVRGRENMNPMPEEEGGKFFVPMNVTTTGDDDDDAMVNANQTALASSLVEIVAQVVSGSVPKDSAKAVIKTSFPTMSQADIDAIVDPIEVKEPEPVPVPIPPVPQETEETELVDEEPQDRSAHISLLSEAIGRACRVVGVWARRAAKDSKTFGEWMEHCEDRNRESVRDILDAPSRVCECERDDVAAQLFAEVRRVLDECYSTKSEKEFASAVDECMTQCETAFAAKLAESILKGQE